MVKCVLLPAAVALALLGTPAARAAGDADLEEIRAQIKDLRTSYEARIRALEDRLKEAEAKAVTPKPAAIAPLAGSSASSASAFNPAISLVLQGRYANSSRQGAEPRGFSLGESELSLFANVDDKFAGKLTVALSPENTVSVEEAYGQWLTAPYGLAPKFGRFLSGLGYLNEQHQHAWDFVDAPLAYNAFLGGQYATDGIQVKWVAPIEHFFELGVEAGNGSASPGFERDKNGSGAGVVFAHSGGDVGVSHSWRAGLGYLESAGANVTVADFVWKYAPNGNGRDTNFKLQGEYLRGDGTSGWYAQGVYQFMPSWRVGVRYDRLATQFNPTRYTAMLDYSPSEFSRLRLQFARNRSLPEVTGNQWFVQYILSLGAHGAHSY